METIFILKIKFYKNISKFFGWLYKIGFGYRMMERFLFFTCAYFAIKSGDTKYNYYVYRGEKNGSKKNV